MRLVLSLLLTLVPALALATGAAQPLPPYPTGTKERYTSDCMNQPLAGHLPQQILEVFMGKVSQKQRYGYCLCQFYYIQSTIPYNTYSTIDALVRQGPNGMNQVRSQYPWFFPHFQKGVESCGAFLRK
jgi:hypothetical protein